MSGQKLPRHARDHLPGGSDPLEITAARDVNPPFFEISPLQMQWWDASNNPGTFDGFAWVADTSLPTGGYMQGTAIGDSMQFGFPMGPRDSIWSVGLGVYQTTDSGKIKLRWGSTPVDEKTTTETYFGGPGFGYGTPKSITHPYVIDGNGPFMDWVDGPGGEVNLYAAAPAFVWENTLSEFYFDGADGAMGSAFNSPGTWTIADTLITGARHGWNGGGDPSVYTWLRIEISSAGTGAGTKANIGWVLVYRRSADRQLIA